MAAHHVSCEARVAWLLATSRLLHPDPEFTHRDQFVAALQERGVTVDNTRISRWESGAVPVPEPVIHAYEDVLGLGHGTLTTVVAGLRRMLGSGPVHPAPDVLFRESADVDQLLDLVTSRRSHGAHWQRLAGELTRHDRVFLRQKEWAKLANRLVVELSRSTGLGYVRRYEAAATLIRHPSAQRHLSRALGSFVMNPDTQVVAPVLNLLAEVDDPGVADLVLRMLSGESRALRRAASSVAAEKLRLGHFTEAELERIETFATHAISRGEPLDGGLDAFDLTIQLPSGSFARVTETVTDRRVQAQLGRARNMGELITRQQAAAVVADLGAAIQADVDTRRHPEPDLLLRRLVREALFHTHKQRRHQAALVLAASPYRSAVSRQCHLLTGGSNYFLAARAWTVLMRVGHAARRSEILLRSLAEPRPTLQSRALVNLGLSTEKIHSGEAKAILAQLTPDSRSSVKHGALFALGMAGAPELKILAEHESGWFRRTASWWIEQGPAIHEPAVPG